jgi:hypothetical protein
MRTELEPPPGDAPVQAGQVVTIEPLFSAEGVCRAVAIVDSMSGEIVTVVPPESVTFADPTTS